MSTLARLAAFAAALVVAGALGAGLGAAVGPIDVGTEPHSSMSSDTEAPGDGAPPTTEAHPSGHDGDGP